MMFIGTDIVDVSRIDLLRRKYNLSFLCRVFSDNEINIVQKKDIKVRSIHYSGKFAAKEAAKKALMSAGLANNIFFKNIEILNKYNGEPYIIVNNSFNKDIIKDFKVSISHTNDYAIANTMLQLV